jgi:hypothetical protein
MAQNMRYERSIDRKQLIVEYIAIREQEAGYYRRYVPNPPSEPEPESKSGKGKKSR